MKPVATQQHREEVSSNCKVSLRKCLDVIRNSVPRADATAKTKVNVNF